MSAWSEGQRAKLRDAMAAISRDATMPHALRVEAAAAGDEPDLQLAMIGHAAALVAAESVEGAIKAHVARARTALREVMEETGGTRLDLPHHRVGLANGKQRVVITDTAAIPADLWRQPPPPPREPDTDAILARLKAGETIAGATLNNPAPHLTIHAKKA